MPKLTKKVVESAKPDPARDLFLWDSELPGFGLRLYPSGRRKYIVQYRTKSHRQRRAGIGPHGALTCEQARARARELLADVHKGGDPAGEVHAARKAPTVADLAARYLEHHAPRKKARSVTQDRRMLERFVLPALAKRKVRDVSRQDVVKLHQGLSGTPYQANRVLALISKMMNLAEAWGFRSDGSNPCRHVEKYAEKKRERFLSDEELARLAEVLAEAEHTQTESPSVIAAIRLLLFTGARLSEILTLRWEDVDLERQCLRLPDSKTGAKVIYLSPPAQEVLNALDRVPDQPHVISGKKPGAHLVNLEKPWLRIRARAGLEGVRLHDLRHSFASVAAAGGLSLPMIGALLGHSQPATTARYAHLAADPMQRAAELVGHRLSRAMKEGRRAARAPDTI